MTKADHQLQGLEISFYPNDHEPEHFHVRRQGEWEMKVYFRLCTTKHLEFEEKWKLKSTGPSKADKQKLREYVEQHRGHLEHEWTRKACQD